MKQTSIKIGDKTYPLYKTMRAQVDLERSAFKQKDIKNGAIEAVLYALYCLVKGACIREKIEFDMDFETFVDNVEPNALEKLAELNDDAGDNPDKKKE
ncbi:hypothetical protein ACT29H_01680 [Thermophagus sp. OGC60D27]|uniref:hypothetical protein n=1 Tax=Thermophagus sp. OGC60D27 TaxID=3458415 RepID=UPI004037CFA6